MKWNRGFTSSFYAFVVDPVTWRDKERFELVGGEINRTNEGLQQSADIDIATRRHNSEQYIRIYLEADQGGANTRVPLFTGIAYSPENATEDGFETNSLECYSVLKAADDVQLERGFFVPKGSNAVDVVKELLLVTPAPIDSTGESPTLKGHLLAEDEETRLSMAQKVLEAVNWRMRIDGRGEILLSEYSNEPVARFDPVDNDIIQENVDRKHDWFSAPNVFRAISDSETAVARDDSEGSALSTANRGREVWASDTSPDLNSGESLAEFSVRRLKELQQVADQAEYDRRFAPEIYVGDVVHLHYPEQGLDGLYRITSQKIELEFGATTSEEVEKI